MLKLEDAQAIVNLTAKALGIKKPIRVLFNNDDHATAFTDERFICFPHSAREYPVKLTTYVLAHEVAHFHCGGLHHGLAFRKVEDKALKFWGISINRSNGPYPANINDISQR